MGYPREYAAGRVELTIIPEATMEWVHWFHAIKSIHFWLMTYDSVDMDFDVVVDGVGTVGTGRLTNVIIHRDKGCLVSRSIIRRSNCN